MSFIRSGLKLVMASSISSINDALDGISSSKITDPLVLQKKLQKIDKCIVAEEKTLQTIQDDLINFGIIHAQKSPQKYHAKVRELEEANNKASRHIEEYKQKKRKYEQALKNLEEQSRIDQEKQTKKDSEKVLASNSDVTKGSGSRMLNTLMRSNKNGESGGSARSKESRGSREESLIIAQGGGMDREDALAVSSMATCTAGGTTTGKVAALTIAGELISVSSLESDSQESQKRQRRVEEIGEIVDEKLEPLVGDVHDLKEKVDQLFKGFEDSKVELTEERKANIVIFDDIIRRCGYVEEQIHDLIELHQKETAETKTYLVDTQDKMNYIFHERIRDMKEEITGLNTRIAKIEHRQKEDESLARTEAAKSVMGEMAFKMVDCVLLFGQLVIAVVGAITQFFQMTAENSTRLVIFLVCIIAFLVVFQFRADLPFSQEISLFFYHLNHWIAWKIFSSNWTVENENLLVNDTADTG